MRSLLPFFLIIALIRIAHAGGFSETFESLSDDTLVNSGSIPDWSQRGDNPDGKAVVKVKSGYNDSKGLVIESASTFVQWQSNKAAWRAADGPAEFSVDFCLIGKIGQLNIVVSQYGYSGFWIGIEPQTIKVSTGGKTAFECSSQSCIATIESVKWYTLVLKNIELSESVAGGPISGMLYIYEKAKPINTVLDGIKIIAAGQDRPFVAINQIDFRRFGGVANEANIQLDNVHIGESKKDSGAK